MITLQHTLITLLSANNTEEFKEQIPYVLLPDAIRKYLGPRQYSHFEKARNGKDVSWLKYPQFEDIKDMNKENVQFLDKHLVSKIEPCVLGEETDLKSFELHNKHLKGAYYLGVKKHLNQDYIFDKSIRHWFDTNQKYDNKFEFNGQEMNGQEVRKKIADIENHGVYILAYQLYKEKGITTNQQWFDENVKPRLDRIYSKDLSDGTYGYMKIPKEIDEWISMRDWSHLDECTIPYEEYDKLYSDIRNKMSEIQIAENKRLKKLREFAEKESKNHKHNNEPNKHNKITLKTISSAIKHKLEKNDEKNIGGR